MASGSSLKPVSGYGGIGVIETPNWVTAGKYGDGGVMIQAGDHPELGDAERGAWPELYVKLAKYLKPIRITEHGPFQLASSIGPRFDRERSEAWLRRFDERNS